MSHFTNCSIYGIIEPSYMGVMLVIIAYLVLLIALVSLILGQYIRVALCRILTLRRIRKICSERNIKFKVLNHTYFFSSNNRDKFDFILRIGKTVIPVKFFSAVDKKATVILEQSGNIHIRKKVRQLLGKNGKAEYRLLENTKALPSMMIEKRIIGEKMKCFPIFLNEPPYETIFFADANGEVSEFYDVSNRVAGCNWADSKTFKDLIMLYINREDD